MTTSSRSWAGPHPGTRRETPVSRSPRWLLPARRPRTCWHIYAVRRKKFVDRVKQQVQSYKFCSLSQDCLIILKLTICVSSNLNLFLDVIINEMIINRGEEIFNGDNDY